MQDLENKIAAWRARLNATLPGQEETVRELEEHLRDHIAAQGRRGMAPEAALADGVAKLGDPRVLAREFGRIGAVADGEGTLGGWAVRPMIVIYALVGSGCAAIWALMLWNATVLHMNRLLATHVAVLTAGYLAMLAAGLVGLWMVRSGLRPAAAPRVRRTQRRELLRLTVIGSVLVPVGMGFGAVWLSGPGHSPAQWWSWAPVETGALTVLVSTWLLLVVQLKPGLAGDRGRAALALLVAAVVAVAWLAKGLAPILPYPWLCAALVAVQVALALGPAWVKRGTINQA